MKSKINPRTKAFKPADLISYQDGAVVSREIISKPTGTVTLFSFDKGQGLSEHKAPFDALLHVLEGRAEVQVSGQPHNLGEGEMIIMPAGFLHSVKALSKFKMVLIMIRS